jgi:hypothetical protein
MATDKSGQPASPFFVRANWRGETGRILVLIATAVWLFHPFATHRFVGTGDALWYANMLADFVLQWRAGIFPVFVGQTEFAFNGAVYPLRVAPLFQHWGGVLDLFTGQRLSFFCLQHLVAITVGCAGLGSAYFCLRRLTTPSPWEAVLLAVLYITCPGVLALVYTQDLYMSWMTVPFLPWVFYGVVRSFQDDDWNALICISAGLAGTWLAHAPIAMWSTIVVVATQAIRLLAFHRSRGSWSRAGLAVCLFLLLGSQPFVSLHEIKTPELPTAAASTPLARPEQIVQFLYSAVPGCFEPLSQGAGSLSDIQLGYSLFAMLAIAMYSFARARNRAAGVLLICATGLLFVVIPIPGWSELFWLKIAPEPVRRLTYYWPMHRIYAVLAAMLPFVLQSARWQQSKQTRRGAFITILVLAGIWSCTEARQFIYAGKTRTASEQASQGKRNSNNITLTSHAYGLFSRLPAYFSNGVMDAEAELRLLDPATNEILAKACDGSFLVSEGALVGTIDINPGIVKLAPEMILNPRKKYDLDVKFGPGAYTGTLQLAGSSMSREYMLPSSGERLAFGITAPNSSILPIWTTQDTKETVTLRFIPSGPNAKPAQFLNFGSFSLYERAEARAPIRLLSQLPFRVETNFPSPTIFESNKMFTPGYTAVINGQTARVFPTRELLVGALIPAGHAEIALYFEGSRLLRWSYWLTAAAWISFFSAVAAMASASAIRKVCKVARPH